MIVLLFSSFFFCNEGNDIAMAPSLKTIWNMTLLLKFNKTNTIENNIENCYGTIITI